MSLKEICELLVSWEILGNRAVAEVTKMIVNGEAVPASDMVKLQSAANQNGANHSVTEAHGNVNAATNACETSQEDCSQRSRHHSGSKSGPIHLHPFMHPELVDAANCELRILCAPRSNLRIVSIEADSNAKHLELYDANGEYMLTAKGNLTANRESYTARCAMDRNVFEVVLKFLSLLDPKCLTITSLSIVFEHYEWPKDVIANAAATGKTHGANQMAHATSHPHGHVQHPHPHPHLTGPIPPALFAAGLQRAISSSNASNSRPSTPVPGLADAHGPVHGASLGQTSAVLAYLADALASACGLSSDSTASPQVVAINPVPHLLHDRPVGGPYLRQLAATHFANHSRHSVQAQSVPAAADAGSNGDARRTSDSPSTQAAGNTAISNVAAQHDHQLASFVCDVSSAMYADLVEHIDRRFAQLEIRLARHVDERIAHLARSAPPNTTANAGTGAPNVDCDRLRY